MKRTLEYINSHPLNKSKTKEAHTFSKSPRFSRDVESGNYSTFYDLSKSAAQIRLNSTANSFTKSRRFAEADRKRRELGETPSPHSYQSPNFFEQSLKKNKGITIPHSPKSRTRVEEVPGPGAYSPGKFNPQQRPVYSIGKEPKLKANSPHWNRLGPGQYESRDIKRSPSPVTIGHEARFKYKGESGPAPGEYYRDRKLTEESRVFSKSPKFSFGASKRSPLVDKSREHSPGPGYYNTQFSEFSERSQRIMSILNRL